MHRNMPSKRSTTAQSGNALVEDLVKERKSTKNEPVSNGRLLMKKSLFFFRFTAKHTTAEVRIHHIPQHLDFGFVPDSHARWRHHLRLTVKLEISKQQTANSKQQTANA